MTMIDPTRSLRLCLALVALLATAPLASAADADARPSDKPPARRPNIVLIMADDMGFSDIGCYGGEIATPNLDGLAAQGLRFSRFYNNAKCTTTRASLLTGLYPRRQALLTPEMVTIGEALRASGYRTALSGKWHLGSKPPLRPIDRGFDEFYGLMDGACNYFNPARPDPAFKGGGVRVWGHNDTIIKEFPDGFYTTDAISDHAARTIRRYAGEGGPFLVHVCYNAPHYPLHARPEDIARYQGKYMMGWDELRLQRHRRQVEMGLIDAKWQAPPRDPEARAWDVEPNKEWQDLRMAVYAAMVDTMDRGIGRILAALRDSGVEDNTLVLFLSDNGGCAELPGGEDPSQTPGPEETYTACGPGWAYAQNTPFRRFKTWAHEGGISTPLVVRWPGVVAPNTITHQVGHIIDLMPTLLDVAGGTYPTSYQGHPILPVEGLSLVPILQGRDRPGHDTLFWEWSGNRAIRRGNWKLAWDKKIKKWELYDLDADRTETRDLAASHPDRVTKMAAAWTDWAARTGVNKAKSRAAD
jgi:arylsulfatase A-like enzyme